MPIDKSLASQLLQSMLRIRRLEEQVIHIAQDHPGLIRFHYHVYIGQEATAAGVCGALRRDDYVFTTHRNHGHVSAKGGDSGRILAEILARVDGYCGGRAGTFHIAAPEMGILHSSAIVGGCVPLGAGAAWGVRQKGTDQATVVFFGDGTMEEGATYEALNLAAVWQLPVIFCMEHNGRGAQWGTRERSASHGASDLTDVPRSLNIVTTSIDGGVVEAVYETTAELVSKVRMGEGPFFLETRIERWPGNNGMFPRLLGGDTNITWAWEPASAPEALGAWGKEYDPVMTYARKLVAGCVMSRQEIVDMDASLAEEARQATEFAFNSPEPKAETTREFVYA